MVELRITKSSRPPWSPAEYARGLSELEHLALPAARARTVTEAGTPRADSRVFAKLNVRACGLLTIHSV